MEGMAVNVQDFIMMETRSSISRAQDQLRYREENRPKDQPFNWLPFGGTCTVNTSSTETNTDKCNFM